MKSSIPTFFYHISFNPAWNEKFFRKNCRENQNMLFMLNNFFPENCAIYEIMWKNNEEPNRPQMKTWRMSIACWIIKATDTHSEYVILLFHCNNSRMNVPQCYLIYTLPELLHSIFTTTYPAGPSVSAV